MTCHCRCFAECLRQKQDPMPDVLVMYEDQPYGDFKSLFLMANGEYIKHNLSHGTVILEV